MPLQRDKFTYNPALLTELITPIASPWEFCKMEIGAVLEKVWCNWLLKRVLRPFSKPTAASTAVVSHGNQLVCTLVNRQLSSLLACLGLNPTIHGL